MSVYTRAERLQQIHKLTEAGFSHREVSAQLGISVSTIRGYLHDPDNSKNIKRRERYRGTCKECGEKTDGSSGRQQAPQICEACYRLLMHEGRHWTQERIIESIHQFAKQHGRRPVATEWLQPKEVRGVDYPNTAVVLREFGSWANGIEAAGFERPIQSQYFIGDRHKPKGFRVSTETMLQRIRDHAENGIAPPANSDPVRSTHYTLLRRGIGWAEACEMAGVQPRMNRGWQKRLGLKNG